MIEEVKNFIKENELSNKTCLVGLSGGVDSSVLCDILSKIDDINVIAIHLNHNWRGDESKRDEEFACVFAKKRGLKFYSETLDASCLKTETAARELRYKFFENAKEKFKADAVFLAHNKNDNAETLLYRLIKGTGPRGLISIPKIRDFYYRPLIDFTREKIEKYAKENNVEYILDSSNFDIKYKRNFIRQEVFPKLREINPEFIDAFSNFINVNIMNQKIVDNALSMAILKTKKDDYFIRDEFLKLSVELKYEIINRFLQDKIKTRDFRTIKKAVEFIENNESSKMSLGQNLFLKVYDNKIYLLENSKKTKNKIILNEGENHFGKYKITVTKSCPPDKFPSEKENVQYLKLDFQNDYILRTRKNGDKIQPFGSNELQKLKDIFMKKKVPLELRDEVPLIEFEGEILCALGVVTSEKLRVEKSDKNCYKVIMKKEN